MKFLILLFSLLLCARPAEAAYVTAGDLLALCRSPEEKDQLACMSYISGVVDYHVMMQSMGTEPSSTDFCLPADLSLPKLAGSVTRYLAASPQEGSFIATPAVLLALGKTYPCGPAPRAAKKKR